MMEQQTLERNAQTRGVDVTFVSADGQRRTVNGNEGASVMEVALMHSVPDIVAECGGALACATCHVYVDEAWLGKLDEVDSFEDEMLDGTAAPREFHSRLSCQIRLCRELSGIVVAVPSRQV